MTPQPPFLTERIEFAALVLIYRDRYEVDRRTAFRKVDSAISEAMRLPFASVRAFEEWLSRADHVTRVCNRKLEIELEKRHSIVFAGTSRGEYEGGSESSKPIQTECASAGLTQTTAREMRQMAREETESFVRRSLPAFENRVATDAKLRRTVCEDYLRRLATDDTGPHHRPR